VEDTLAFERIQKNQNVQTNYETEYRGTFGKFKTADPVERAKTARATADLKSKNKEGLSYSTLFEHGNYIDKLPVSLFPSNIIILMYF
jgi:hypothetical protein